MCLWVNLTGDKIWHVPCETPADRNKLCLMSIHVFYKVTNFLENLEMSWNFGVVMEMSNDDVTTKVVNHCRPLELSVIAPTVGVRNNSAEMP